MPEAAAAAAAPPCQLRPRGPGRARDSYAGRGRGGTRQGRSLGGTWGWGGGESRVWDGRGLGPGRGQRDWVMVMGMRGWGGTGAGDVGAGAEPSALLSYPEGLGARAFPGSRGCRALRDHGISKPGLAGV